MNLTATSASKHHLKLNKEIMSWKTPTLNLLSFKSLSRSLSFSARASRSNARAAIMRPLPILRADPIRRLSFSLFSRGLTGRRLWDASTALPWHPPPKLRRCGLSMTSRSSSFNRSRGSEDINGKRYSTIQINTKTSSLLPIRQLSWFTRDSSLQGNSVICKVFLKTIHGRTALWSGIQWGMPLLRVPYTITASRHQQNTISKRCTSYLMASFGQLKQKENASS